MKKLLGKEVGKMTWCALVSIAALSVSCKDVLDLSPRNDITADQVYATAEGYKEAFLKVYGSLTMTGGNGDSSSDLGGLDASQSDFLRVYWNVQQLTSDETLCGWPDVGIPDLGYGTPNPDNVFVKGLYTRLLYTITVANEFLRESTPEKLSARGIGNASEIETYRTEARFVRAYQYWVLLDLFGSPPFITEEDPIGKTAPKQIARADLFDYVEQELLAIEPKMAAPRQNEYGRADRAAVWTLLARLYLNAEVYTGTPKYTEAVAYAVKTINEGGYSLAANYAHLFMADNHTTSRDEIILTLNYDGFRTKNFGGTTFIINSLINGEMNPADFGVPSGGWGGTRAGERLPQIFGDHSGLTDKRALFYGTKVENDVFTEFTDGLRVAKFRNKTSTGADGGSQGGTLSSLDFPIFRLADVYLMYIEAVLRGGTGGSDAQALAYFNQLRERAYGNASGHVASISLDDVLDERARELYFEGYRRTDLIRFGKFTGGSYLWPWKGGVRDGRTLEDFRKLLPLPITDIIANTNLTQNPGY